MKKISNVFKKATSIFLSAGLILGNTSISLAASSQPEDDLSSFSLLHRVYETEENGLVHYYYEDEDGKRTELSASEDTATSNHSLSLRKAANLPSSYDLRTDNKTTSIKNQGITGSCWSFAAIKSIESNLAMNNLQSADNLDLSESHLAWYAYHPSTTSSDPLYKEGITFNTLPFSSNNSFDEGGNALLATFVLARWSGAVSENKAPFSADTYKELDNMIDYMEEKSEALRYEKEYLMTDAICYDNADISRIKEVLMEDGALDVSYYHNDKYFDKTNNSYYQEYVKKDKAADMANHSVTIVGWDDNYPKENFSSYQPSSDGAWLIANSYGDDFAKNGYSWISYEEPTLVEFYGFHAASSDTYDNNYQYDAYGYGVPIINSGADTTEAANIFTANTDYNQKLTAVGIYTISDNQPYTIKVYRGVTAGKPTSGTLASVLSGTEEFQGYHTIPLEKAVSLNAGERFSVVISYQKTTESNGYIPLEGSSEFDFEYRLIYTSNAGESFLYDTDSNKWVDTSSSLARGISNNVCIKAFTKNTTAPDTSSDDQNSTSQNSNSSDNKQNAAETITFSKSNVTLGVGESYKAAVTIKNSDNTSIFYESSDASIATVNNSGKITAKAEGTAKITAFLSSGTSASLTVKIKKAPSKITVTPAKKKSIAKKDSFQIKVKLPTDSASNTITYSSSKPTVAKVSSTGKVKGLKKGTTTITIQTYNGKTTKIKVTVK